jgi:hypothetical protein
MMNLRNTTMSGLCFLMLAGCNLLTSPQPSPSPVNPDVKPDDKVEVKYTDDDYFAFMAKMVEADVYGSSDQIVKVAEDLKATGTIKDVGRLSELRKKRIEPIRAEDKPGILSVLKGK